jgi:hypothetical protein
MNKNHYPFVYVCLSFVFFCKQAISVSMRTLDVYHALMKPILLIEYEKGQQVGGEKAETMPTLGTTQSQNDGRLSQASQPQSEIN